MSNLIEVSKSKMNCLFISHPFSVKLISLEYFSSSFSELELIQALASVLHIAAASFLSAQTHSKTELAGSQNAFKNDQPNNIPGESMETFDFQKHLLWPLQLERLTLCLI